MEKTEATPQQETGMCKHTQLCLGHTGGKLPDNIVTGVTVLVSRSVTYTPLFSSAARLQKVCNFVYIMHKHMRNSHVSLCVKDCLYHRYSNRITEQQKD